MTEKVKIIKKQKEFNLNSTVNIPKKISTYQIDDYFIFLAPDKASFLTSDKTGADIIDYFQIGATLKSIIATMENRGMPKDEVISKLHNVLVKIERKSFYEDAEVTVVKVETPSLHLDLTNKCNLTCIHCLRDAGKAAENELTTAEWLDVVDRFSDIHKGQVCLSGGEPLLHPGAFDIIKLAKKKGMFVILFTNGTMIQTQEVADELGQYVDRIQMSLDGATAEVNDSIRGKGCFEKVIRASQLLDDKSMEIYIGMALMPQNTNDLEKNMAALTQRLGSRVNFRIAPSMIDGRAQASHVIENKEEAQNQLRSVVGDLYRKHLKAVTPGEKNVCVNNCGYGETLTISSAGDVFPCNIYEDRVKIGNVREQNIMDLIHELDTIRDAANVDNIPECKVCPLKIVCFGGCRLNNFYKHGTISKPSCTPEKKREILDFIVKKEETFDPLELWIQGDDKKVI
jgi:radical SAM protein with 4Fe4S-binding SPASM domain